MKIIARGSSSMVYRPPAFARKYDMTQEAASPEELARQIAAL
jgi:hypothetical protein